MDNRADLIDEKKNIFFEDFVDIIELSDIAESKDGTFLFALEHRVHITLLDDVLTNDLSTGTSEDNT
jgi:hypothetical protein